MIDIGDTVSPIVGPYEGRVGVIKARLPDERTALFEVELRATPYANVTVGKFDPRNLRLVGPAPARADE